MVDLISNGRQTEVTGLDEREEKKKFTPYWSRMGAPLYSIERPHDLKMAAESWKGGLLRSRMNMTRAVSPAVNLRYNQGMSKSMSAHEKARRDH